jgi:serine/threonine protein kinase
MGPSVGEPASGPTPSPAPSAGAGPPTASTPYVCQTCSESGDVWTGTCPKCGGTQHLNLPPKKVDWVGLEIDGRYRILAKVGQGGMGTVYKALREGMGQTLAIKVLNPEFSNEPEVVRRFLREAKSYGMVQHPSAVSLLDFGQLPDGSLYIAMEFVAGDDLGKTIRQLKRIPAMDAVDIAIQCCEVLGFAHEKGIIHRDLKPENIMLMKGLRNYHAKVLDFGIARMVSDTSTQLTVTGSICGTPRYMSPEQAQGREVDPRSDVYSLALVVFEMVTGRAAYPHRAVTDLLRAQVTEPLPHLWEVEGGRDLPESLDPALQRAAAKDPERRFNSMGEFADALSKALPTASSVWPYRSPGGPALDPHTFEEGGPTYKPGSFPRQDGTSRNLANVPTTVKRAPMAPNLSTALTEPPRFGPTVRLTEDPTSKRPAAGRKLSRVVAGVAVALGVLLAIGVLPRVVRTRPAATAPGSPAPASLPSPSLATVATGALGAAGKASPGSAVPDAYWSEKVGHGRDEFLEGRLVPARAILTPVDPRSPLAAEAQKLLGDIDRVDNLHARANRAAGAGNCREAMELWRQALQLSPGFAPARAGLNQCRSAALPQLVE